MRIAPIVWVMIAHVASAHAQRSPERVEAERACAAREPTCDWLATLGILERQSVERAIKARGYTVDNAPWGKVIGSVQVYNEDVFVEKIGWSVLDWAQRVANRVHFTTRESSTYHELVIHEGEVWDQAKVDESARILRDPLYSSVAVTLPVKSKDDGKVDLLVVTRDIWSLRLNTSYTVQQGKLTNLSFSFSENNLLGQRNLLALAFTMDQGEIKTGPLFIDKNVLGEHLVLSAQVRDILNRDALLDHGQLVNEGSDSSVSLSRPLWSLASEWSATASFVHSFSVARRFQGTSIATYDDPDTMGKEAVPIAFEFRTLGTSAQVTRQIGTDVKQQFSLGYQVNDQRPSFLSTFPDTTATGDLGDRTIRAAFARDLFPRSELASGPFLAYRLFTPTFRKLRNVGTYDLIEDVKIGPDVTASLSEGLHALGSDYHFTKPAISGSYTLPWCDDGYVTAGATFASRYQDGQWIDNQATGSLRVVTPTCWVGRIVAQTFVQTRWHDTANPFIAIGGDPILRGFAVNQFATTPGSPSSRFFAQQLELRSRPYALWVLRAGAVAFYDLGGVGESFAGTHLHQDVGVGFRILVPQTSPFPFRFDFPYALDGPTKGLHLIASFESAF